MYKVQFKSQINYFNNFFLNLGCISNFVIATIIGCFVLGVLFYFVYLKLTKKTDLFPEIGFTTTSNYNNRTEEIVTNFA